MERATELKHLKKAEADIAKGRERIERQIELIERMRQDGHDPGTANALLETMRQTLAVMEEHRLLIMKELSE
jgi:hypothetical protein